MIEALVAAAREKHNGKREWGERGRLPHAALLEAPPFRCSPPPSVPPTPRGTSLPLLSPPPSTLSPSRPLRPAFPRPLLLPWHPIRAPNQAKTTHRNTITQRHTANAKTTRFVTFCFHSAAGCLGAQACTPPAQRVVHAQHRQAVRAQCMNNGSVEWAQAGTQGPAESAQAQVVLIPLLQTLHVPW